MSEFPAAGTRKVCLLTGAGGVLGTDLCRRFRHAYAIVAVYRTAPPPVPTQAQSYLDPVRPGRALADNRDPVYAVRADLRDEAEQERVVELALARFGRVDLLVNAAVHVRHDRLATVAGHPAFLEDAFALNTSLPIRLAALVCREHWRHRREENEAWGRNVVNVSSMAGLGLVPGLGLSAYSASKAALNVLTGHLAEELRPIGVRVNALAPTTFPDLVPTAAVGDAVVALDRSDLTGEIVALDAAGSRHLRP